jgi:hypothetical protein
MSNFKDMNLKVKDDIKIVEIAGVKVGVKQYLPAEDKNAILEITMQEADKGTILNTYNLDSLFHLYLVLKYTDINFSNEDKEDMLALFDILESNGIIDAVVAAIPVEEYTTLRDNLLDMVEHYLTYRNSARALVEQFSLFAPNIAEQLKDISQNTDIDKLQQIIKLADATGVNNKIG